MTPPERSLRAHLTRTESLNAVYEGTLIEETGRAEVTIGVTDRRLLGRSADGEFLDVKQEYITSIRSHLHSSPTFRGVDDRLVAGVGAILAVIAVIALVLTVLRLPAAEGMATVGLAVATVAGGSAAELARRRYVRVREALGRLERDRGFDFDLGSDRDRLVLGGLGGGLLAAVSFLWLLAATGPLAGLLVLATVGGLALAEYGVRLETEYEGIEFATEREKRVEITTVDGRTVELRTEPDASLERELGCRSTRHHYDSIESVQYDAP
ncbi:hypothetical protein [Halopiger aswanensis]|uniref:Uncharacterized protein n=1 Tax=Halopiger aswanensis TaxID=148449 RepID=A0A3R7EEL7_9EURY|nr:hypothetical protein [Halopiger aswanensis]RKD94908.1 hypothetical protein ATJ93_1751 [Halopiger aswanensis]